MRYCLRDPIGEIETTAELMSSAVDAHLRGQGHLASELFARANDPTVRAWLDSVWGKGTPWNTPRRQFAVPPILPKELRVIPRYATSETRQAIHDRDGWYCRHCHIPVVRSTIRTLVHEAYPDAVPWGGVDVDRHAGFLCLWAQYDHVLPHARGGSSETANVFLTCAACNYGRGNYLLEDFDLQHPAARPRREGSWDGLERFRLQPASVV